MFFRIATHKFHSNYPSAFEPRPWAGFATHRTDPDTVSPGTITWWAGRWRTVCSRTVSPETAE